ncbi:MAG TPA: ATP-binding protein [Gemmatimonadaceae bacterium]
MAEPSRVAAASPLATVLVHPDGTPVPAWAARTGARVVPASALENGAPPLDDVGCILLDAASPAFVSLARRAHQRDADVQLVAVASADRVAGARRALLFAPGLGEVWIASPTELGGALAERAAGVTGQRRRFARTRARIARDSLAASPQRTERALISDAYLAGLLRVLPDPVFSLDESGRVLSANTAAERAFGGTRGVVGARLGEVLGLAEPPASDLTLLDRAAREGHVTVAFRRSGGERRTGELRAAPMSAGGVGAWAVVLRDITEERATLDQLQETAAELEASNEELQSTTEELLQRTEEAERAATALRESEATYRALVDAIPTLAWSAQADGYIDWYNERWYEYTGTTPEAMEGWGWQSVHDPEVLPVVLARWEASIATGRSFEMTFPLRGADGRFRPFLTRIVPLRDEDGRVVRWFGTNTDVEAERASRVRIERLQALTEALAATQTLEEVAAVVVAKAVDAAGARTGMLAMRTPGTDDVVIVQHAGLSEEVMRGYSRFTLASPGPAAACLRTGEPVFVESRDGPGGLRARFPEMPEIWESLGAQALAAVPLAAAGEVVGALSFTFTTPRAFPPDERAFFLSLARQGAQAVERARLFAAERAARQQADEANRAKSQFLATMSHELRTPLNAISGYVSLVSEGIYGPVTPEQRTALDRVMRAQGHLLGLINDVLSFARLEGGRVEYELEPVNLSELVGGVLPLVEPQLTGKGLAFAVRLPEERGEPPVLVRADREKLAQILVNLLSNAIKFTPAGGRIAVEVAPAPAASGRPDAACLRVRDTGIGIPADKLGVIFEPFTQVRAELTRTREGTGLGLAIARDLARGMSGELTVESVLGEGSTFIVRLPVAASPDQR